MLRFVILASLAVSLSVVEAGGVKCDSKAMGASVNAVKEAGNRNSCVCKSKGTCSKLKVQINGDNYKYSAGQLGEWSASSAKNTLKITSGPEKLEGTIVYPVKGNNYIVYVFCSPDKEPEMSYVEFKSKDAATSQVLKELKSKYKIEIKPDALKKC